MFTPAPLFKTDRIRHEYEDGGFHVRKGIYIPHGASGTILENARFIPVHHDIYPLIWAADWWHVRETGRHVRLTDIGRTRQEQIVIYGGDESVFVSPHEDGRAFDFSVHQLLSDRRQAMTSYLKQRFIYVGSSRYNIAILHDVAGLHIHVQVSPRAVQFLPEGSYE